MSEKKEREIYQVRDIYQGKVDKPLHNPPRGGSNVMPPPKSQKEEK